MKTETQTMLIMPFYLGRRLEFPIIESAITDNPKYPTEISINELTPKDIYQINIETKSTTGPSELFAKPHLTKYSTNHKRKPTTNTKQTSKPNWLIPFDKKQNLIDIQEIKDPETNSITLYIKCKENTNNRITYTTIICQNEIIPQQRINIYSIAYGLPKIKKQPKPRTHKKQYTKK